jgi:hypothetical protein
VVPWYAALGTGGNRLNDYSSSDLYWEQFPFSVLRDALERAADEQRRTPVNLRSPNPDAPPESNPPAR